MSTFKGLTDGAYTYKAVAPLQLGSGWRVRTFDRNKSVALFLAGFVGRARVAALFEERVDAKSTVTRLVELTDDAGRPVEGNLRHVLPLLSDDESKLLELFGVNLAALQLTGRAPW